MNVPNIKKKAFRDMTAEERSAIVEARVKGVVDIFNPEHDTWGTAFAPSIRIDGIYRTRQRKLEIPWEHIKPEFKWAVMQKDGSIEFYSEKPSLREHAGKGYFQSVEQHSLSIRTNGLLNIDTSGIDWRESLTQRPED